MDEYNRLLGRLNSFLSYEEVINNEEVISAYDYINLLRKEYNKSKKVSVSEELVSRIDRGYELIQKRHNRKEKYTKEVEYIESIEVFTGSKVSRIRVVTSSGETYICRYNDTKEIFMTGHKLNQEFISKYLKELNRLFDASETYLQCHKDEFTDSYSGVVHSNHSDGTVSVDIIYDSEEGVHYDIKLEGDTEDTLNKEWLIRKSLKDIVNENEKGILKRIPVNVRNLPPLGLKVTERYTHAYRQMNLNKKMITE